MNGRSEVMAMIVHVEDDADTRKVVKDVLAGKGYVVVSVGNPKKAVEAVKKAKPKLVLLDIMMPGMPGWDVYRAIRKVDQKVKVAFLSVLEVSPERKKKLVQEGISDYILKPFTATDLIERVRKMAKP